MNQDTRWLIKYNLNSVVSRLKKYMRFATLYYTAVQGPPFKYLQNPPFDPHETGEQVAASE